MKFVCTLIFLLVLTVPPAFSQGPMKFVYFENFAPYSWKVDKRMRGILIDIVNEVVRGELGIAVSHEGYPWKRAQAMVATNEADAFITTPIEKRRAYTIVSEEPVTLHAMTVFTHKDNRRVRALETIDTIAALQLFTAVNYIGNGWAEKKLQGVDVYWVPTMDQALFLLANNRYDFYVGSATNVRYTMKKLGYEKKIVATPIILDSISHNLCVGKRSPYVTILPAFDEAIKKLRKAGALQKILARYE